jgi:hypothetical protein
MNSRLAALATAALLASCFESAPSSVVNGVAVGTQISPTADFTNHTTFSVDPTIAVVDQTGSVTVNREVDGSQIAGTIAQNMTARGFTEKPWAANDTVVTNTADLQFTMQALLGSADVYYPGYCGWYPYYYCYPGWTYAGSYSFGTLVITMGDRKAIGSLPPGDPNAKLPLLWTNANYGILQSYCSGANCTNINWGRVAEAVNRAFAQSPSIKATP